MAGGKVDVHLHPPLPRRRRHPYSARHPRHGAVAAVERGHENAHRRRHRLSDRGDRHGRGLDGRHAARQRRHAGGRLTHRGRYQYPRAKRHPGRGL